MNGSTLFERRMERALKEINTAVWDSSPTDAVQQVRLHVRRRTLLECLDMFRKDFERGEDDGTAI